ncbi:hypothetical protein KGF56_000891 [Candida oxycetoniae]|uniref:Trafficking protein particle complex II-specific subunit 65 IgD3 domain-containing protein n=1 Tax=Candida oxycetoniae TaxID=497107 RepID=A0AAI9T0Y5_9ASCO|nr:uncharacterized protein KGF56_000891 [Candida oxycetoniae]KAI3406410.2 hypothetical protein KGF56_000891 [Candida oxycetoniae]
MDIKIIVPTKERSGKNEIFEEIENNENRSLLFFDEIVVGYVVLAHRKSAPYKLKLEASFSSGNGAASKQDFETAKDDEVIAKCYLSEKDVVVCEDELTVWKFKVPAVYPRMRMEDPCLQLSCFYTESHEISTDAEHVPHVILSDYMPVDDNDSEPCEEDTITTATTTTTATVSQSQKESSIVKVTAEATAEICIPITVSLVIKMKSTKPAGRNDVLLAALNIECAEELLTMKGSEMDKTYFDILYLEVSFESGLAVAMGSTIPQRLKSTDSINSVHKFINNEPTTNRESTRPVLIRLQSRMQKLVNGKFENVSNLIQTEWTPFLDFGIIASPINNALRTSNSHSTTDSQASNLSTRSNFRHRALYNGFYKLKGSSNSMLSASSLGAVQGPPMTRRIKSNASRVTSSVTVNLSTNLNSSLSGLKLTFVGKIDIKLGQLVTWKIQAINTSMNRLNLSLLVQKPVNFNLACNNFEFLTNTKWTANTTTTTTNTYINNTTNSLAGRGEIIDNGVIILNNDIRMPLDPQMVFETEIQMIGLKKGIYNLDGIKLYEINSGDGLDFGKLIEVFVV